MNINLTKLITNLTDEIKIDDEVTSNTQLDYTTGGVAVKCGYQIDGKDVYVKRINFGALPNNGTKTVATGIDFSKYTLIKIEGIAKFANNNIAFSLPFAHPSMLSYSIMVNIDNSNNIAVTTASDRSGYNGSFNIYYI